MCVKSHSAAFIWKCCKLACLMLSFTLIYAAIQTCTDTASAKYKIPHSIQRYCALPKVMKIVPTPNTYLIVQNALSSSPNMQAWTFKKVFIPGLCLPPQPFLKGKKSSGAAQQLQPSCPNSLSGKRNKPHTSLAWAVASSSLNFTLILLRIYVCWRCLWQQSLTMFPTKKKDCWRRTKRYLLQTDHSTPEQRLPPSSARHFCRHQWDSPSKQPPTSPSSYAAALHP